jgi:hypothetical protein
MSFGKLIGRACGCAAVSTGEVLEPQPADPRWSHGQHQQGMCSLRLSGCDVVADIPMLAVTGQPLDRMLGCLASIAQHSVRGPYVDTGGMGAALGMAEAQVIVDS